MQGFLGLCQISITTDAPWTMEYWSDHHLTDVQGIFHKELQDNHFSDDAPELIDEVDSQAGKKNPLPWARCKPHHGLLGARLIQRPIDHDAPWCQLYVKKAYWEQTNYFLYSYINFFTSIMFSTTALICFETKNKTSSLFALLIFPIVLNTRFSFFSFFQLPAMSVSLAPHKNKSLTRLISLAPYCTLLCFLFNAHLTRVSAHASLTDLQQKSGSNSNWRKSSDGKEEIIALKINC